MYVDFADAQLGGQGLQFAVLAAVAGLAVAVMLGKQQFDDRSPGLADAAGVGDGPSCPAAAGMEHEAHEVPRPSTSTTQTRQAPIACRPST